MSMSNGVITATMQLSRPAAGMESYLTGNPKQSMFSAYEHQQHTPYAKNTVTVPFNEKLGFGKTLSAEVPYAGDLIHNIHVYFRLPPLPVPPDSTYAGYTNSIGYAMIDSVELRIGEQIIVTRPGLFMEVQDYLHVSADKKEARWKAIGRYDNVKVLAQNALGYQDILVPLNLWFAERPASALPLLKLGGLAVRVVVRLKPFSSCVTHDGMLPPTECPPVDGGLLVEYYVLNEDEKAAFRDEDQTYLIEQWQVERKDISAGMTSNRFSLDFNLSVKELVWILIEHDSEENNDFFNFGRRNQSLQGGELISTFSFFLDGKELVKRLPESYARLILPQRHHTFAGDRNIYCLPFSEFPEITHQPSGTCNMSAYDTIELGLDFVKNLPATALYVLAVSYNRLLLSENSVTLEFIG